MAFDNEVAAVAAEVCARVIGLGREGLGRWEIAAALDLGMAELGELEAADAGFAAAMRRAADLERAWWEAQPREALAAGVRLQVTAWREAMGWRFGGGAAAAERAEQRTRQGAAEPAAQA